MIVLLHVIIALASVLFSSLTFFKSSAKRIAISYGLIAATVASGTYLMVTTPNDILKSCLAGLVYVATVTLITAATHIRVRRLAAVRVHGRK